MGLISSLGYFFKNFFQLSIAKSKAPLVWKFAASAYAAMEASVESAALATVAVARKHASSNDVIWNFNGDSFGELMASDDLMLKTNWLFTSLFQKNKVTISSARRIDFCCQATSFCAAGRDRIDWLSGNVSVDVFILPAWGFPR